MEVARLEGTGPGTAGAGAAGVGAESVMVIGAGPSRWGPHDGSSGGAHGWKIRKD